MKSRDNIPPSGPIPFPKSSRGEVTPPTDEDRAIAREHDAEIRELCRDTALALQGLRHGIANVFRDTLEKMDLNAAAGRAAQRRAGSHGWGVRHPNDRNDD